MTASTTAWATSTRSTPERVFDILLGVSFFSWAVLGLGAERNGPTPVRLSIAALHVCTGLLVLRRQPSRQSAPFPALVASLPAIVVGGLALRTAAPLSEWSLGLELVFSTGAGLAIGAFCRLNRSFAVLPALRRIVTEGPYRYLRHPGYAGELLMLLCCALSHPSTASAGIVVFGFAFVAVRIHCEERLLERDPGYRRYREDVRWRLAPGLW